jgi:acylglycerol lipase
VLSTAEPGLPFFVLGHSAGGVIASLFAADHATEMAGLICEGFAFELPPPDVALAILKGISHLAPHAHLLNLKDEDFSRDPNFVEQMKNDPLVNHTPGTLQLLAEIVRADGRLKEQFRRITLPVLILHGTGDRVAKPHGSQRFCDEAGAADKTLKLYDGHFHDLLNDVGKEQVVADIIAWISARLAK